MADYIDNVKVGSTSYRVQPTLYGACTDAAATVDKTVSIANFVLTTGVTIHVKFSNANGVANPTLNVNGTGKITIKRYGTTAPSTSAATSWNAGAVVALTYDGTYWQINDWLNDNTNTNTVPSAYCTIADAAKTATCTNYVLTANTWLHVLLTTANTAKSALTFNVNSKGAKPIYINGSASSASNYTLPAGSYLVFYDGTNYYFRTDGKLTASITGDAATVNGKTVGVNVPADAKFTDTTYSSKTAASGGTDVSLVTTGEKYTWNNKSNLAIGTTATTAAAGNHTHATSIATSTGTNQITLAANTKYAITAGGTSYVFTTPPDTNTTYSNKAAASGGTDVSLVTTGEKYTWNNKSSLAIGTTATTAAAGNHTHGLSIAASTGTNAITLAASTKYQLTAGGSTYIFTTPPNTNTWTAFAGASASADGTAGYVPAPGKGNQAKFFRADGTWVVPTNTWTAFAGASASADGTAGYVPAPGKGNQAKFFRGDGTWAVPTDTDTNYYHTSGSWNGLTYTATANGGAGALAFTLPTGTTATTVAVGNHTHSGYLTSHQTIKQDGITGATANRYGACTTAADTAAKTVAITAGTFSLEAGAKVTVKFNNANTASSPTLKVGSTDAKNIFHRGSQITTGANKALLAGVCEFVYDGTQYHLIGNYYDTTYTAATAAPGNIASSGAQGSSSNYARQDHTHGIALATGDSNGQVKIAGTNVSVKGLGSAAYTDTTDYVTSSAIGNGRIFYATCSTAAGTQAKAVTIEGYTEYKTGDVFVILFSAAQTYNGLPQLKVNSLSAISIKYINGATTSRYFWCANEVVTMVYNGTDFIINQRGIATTTYYGITKLTSSTSSTSTALAASAAGVKAAYDAATAANTAAVASRVVIVDVSASTSTSTTIDNAAITADHVPLNDVVTGTTADVDVTTAAGSVTIECTAGIPAFRLILALPQ